MGRAPRRETRCLCCWANEADVSGQKSGAGCGSGRHHEVSVSGDCLWQGSARLLGADLQRGLPRFELFDEAG
jgi:hypothetical protein